MKATLLFCLMAAVHQGFSAPVMDRPAAGKPQRSVRTIVRVSRHRGPLNSFLASEEVSTAISGTRPRPPQAEVGHALIDNAIVDPPEDLAPSAVLDLDRPLPTEYLLALPVDGEGSGGSHHDSKHAPGRSSWATSLKDVYTDYRSSAPCWRQRSANASARIHEMAKDMSGLLVILGFGCFVVAVLAIEALIRSVLSLRRHLSCNHGAIRLEGPERRLEQASTDAAGIDTLEKSAAM